MICLYEFCNCSDTMPSLPYAPVPPLQHKGSNRPSPWHPLACVWSPQHRRLISSMDTNTPIAPCQSNCAHTHTPLSRPLTQYARTHTHTHTHTHCLCVSFSLSLSGCLSRCPAVPGDRMF